MTPTSPRTRGAAPARRRPPWLWIIVAGVVVIAAIVAVVASRQSGTTKTAAGTEQTRPVKVDGAALPALADGADPAVGQVAPQLNGASFDGSAVALTRDGNAKLVLFVAHWCPHCQREVPLLASYLRTHKLPAGIDLLTIATATSADRPNYPPSAWLQKEGLPGRVLADSADGTAAQAFGLPAFPYFVALDREGRVIARTSGEISTEQFAALIQKATK